MLLSHRFEELPQLLVTILFYFVDRSPAAVVPVPDVKALVKIADHLGALALFAVDHHHIVVVSVQLQDAALDGSGDLIRSDQTD